MAAPPAHFWEDTLRDELYRDASGTGKSVLKAFSLLESSDVDLRTPWMRM